VITEVYNQGQMVVGDAKDGTPNFRTSIPEDQLPQHIEEGALNQTIAETQTVRRPFGAIL